MFGLALLPDQLEHWIFQDWVNMVKGLCLWSFYVWRPCKDHVETMLGLVFLPDQLEHWNFQDWVSMVQGPCLESVYLWGPCQDHVRTMFGLTLLLDQLEQWNFHPWDNMVKSLCLWSVYFVDPVRTMLRPCFASLYFQTCQSTKIFKTESKWSKAHVYGSSIFGTMPGPWWDHLWPSFTYRPERALKFSRLSQHGLLPMSLERLSLGTM